MIVFIFFRAKRGSFHKNINPVIINQHDLLLNKKIFWRMLVTKQMMLAIDYHFFPYYRSQCYHQLFGYQNSSFVFNRKVVLVVLI